jgi:hypothetical protein
VVAAAPATAAAVGSSKQDFSQSLQLTYYYRPPLVKIGKSAESFPIDRFSCRLGAAKVDQ